MKESICLDDVDVALRQVDNGVLLLHKEIWSGEDNEDIPVLQEVVFEFPEDCNSKEYWDKIE